MKKIVVTNEKGGTGKSTCAVLLVEYLNYRNFKTQLTDTDPLQTAQTWANNCQELGRNVSSQPSDYQVIDTAGSSGSSLNWIKQADLILVPLQMNYADLKVTRDWFWTLNKSLQKKIVLLPNRWQNTKEQREGAKQLQQIVIQEEAGYVLPPLTNRAALYGELLNGSLENFFNNKKSQEAENVMRTLLISLKEKNWQNY